MAKYIPGMPVSKEKYKYPSRFGSHESMVVEDESFELNHGEVVCEDEFGRYKTTRKRLDDGLADPARFVSSRLGKLYEKTTDKK